MEPSSTASGAESTVMGDGSVREPLDIVMAVHNEVHVIEAVVDELLLHAQPIVKPRILVCEDGSTDGTRELVAHLALTRPIVLLSSPLRRGYAGAMISGLRAVETPWVLTLDGDGQCSPRELSRLLAVRHDADAVRGVRTPRRDPPSRLVMSALFRVLHEALFSTALEDPSSPFGLLRSAAVRPLLDRMGSLPSGLWWEFSALADRSGLRTVQIPVEHRRRAHGRTRAFPWRSVPGIALSHATALVRIRRAGRDRLPISP